MPFFDEFTRSTAEDRKLLLRKNDIELYQFSHYHYLCSGDHIVQGALNTLKPSQVQSPVVDAMLTGLQLTQAVESVLNLGIGCAAIERYLDINCPTLSVTTVDCSSDMIELCVQAKLLPECCTPVLADAAEFLAQTEACFDIVFCDLAVGNQQPEMLCAELFYADCQKRMTAGAMLMVNVLCANNEALSRVCLAARKVFGWTAVVDIPGFDNVVMYAANAPPSIDRTCVNDARAAELTTLLSQVQILP